MRLGRSTLLAVALASAGCAGSRVVEDKPVHGNPHFSHLALGVDNEGGGSGACLCGGATSVAEPMTRVYLAWGDRPETQLDIAGMNLGGDPPEEVERVHRLQRGDFKLAVLPDGTAAAVSLDDGANWNFVGLGPEEVPFFCNHDAFKSTNGNPFANAPTRHQIDLEALHGQHRRNFRKYPPRSNPGEKQYSSAREFQLVMADVSRESSAPDIQAAWRDFVVLPMPPKADVRLPYEQGLPIQWARESADEELLEASKALLHDATLRSLAVEAAGRADLGPEQAEHAAWLLARTEHRDTWTALVHAVEQPALDAEGCRRRNARLVAMEPIRFFLLDRVAKPDVKQLNGLRDDPNCPPSRELLDVLEVIP